MYNIIPLILILVSLSIIIVIVVRKFSVLASLDVDNIPAEKEAKFKERIISNRLKRNIIKWWSKFSRFLTPVFLFLNKFFEWTFKKINKKLHELREENQRTAVGQDSHEGVDLLFGEAEEFKKQDKTEEAEKRYVKIISLDSKNIRAFKELGKLYFEQKNYEEAKQTFEHILKLKEDDEDIYDSLAQIAREKGDLNEAKEDYLKLLNINKESAQAFCDLAQVYEAMGNNEEASSSIKKALKIEPNNPRYLDTMLEISIIIKDKTSALSAYEKLAKANPENKKLEEFKKQIDQL